MIDNINLCVYNIREVIIMAMAEKIRILLVKRGNISEAELARRMGISPQNLHNKMKRDNFTESDLWDIATALDCNLSINFQLKDTGETLWNWITVHQGVKPLSWTKITANILYFDGADSKKNCPRKQMFSPTYKKRAADDFCLLLLLFRSQNDLPVFGFPA